MSDTGSPIRAATNPDATPTAPAFEPEHERGLLVVLPHPDDESFATGGTIARAAAAGVPATYLCGTYGDMGRRMGRPAFTNREALRDVRTAELKDACHILGCDVRFMGLRDKCVEFEDPEEVAAQIRGVITELRPSVVFTFYPGHGVHPDHDALGHATVLAVRGLPETERPRLLAVAVGDREQIRAELGEPHLVTDIEAFAEKKLDALRSHRSQTEVMFAQWADAGSSAEQQAQGAGAELEPSTPQESHDAPATQDAPAPQDAPASQDAQGPQDDQAKAFRDEFIKRERFFELDPDAPTLLETRD